VIALCFLSLPNLFAQVSQHDDTCHDKLTEYVSQISKDWQFGVGGSGTQKLAQTFFTTSGTQMTRVDLYLKRVGSPAGNIWAEIWSASSSDVLSIVTFGDDNREARSGKINVTDIPTADYAFTSFILPKGIDVSGTYFAIVLRCDYTYAAGNYIDWGAKEAAGYDPLSPGRAYGYDGSDWNELRQTTYTHDFTFKSYYGETNAFPLDQLPLGTGILDAGLIPSHNSGKHTISSGNITTYSTSFVDTGFSVTITTTGTTALVTFVGAVQIANVGSTLCFDIIINDSIRVGNTTYGLFFVSPTGAGYAQNGSFSVLVTGLTPGSNKFELQWRVDGSTGTIRSASTEAPTLNVIGL